MSDPWFTDNPVLAALDERRGHPFCPPDDVRAAVPRLYATELTPPADKTVWLHYFCASADWWIVEVDEAFEVAFGYANLGDPANAEWGYVPLGELAAVEIAGSMRTVKLPNGVERTMVTPRLMVERDLYWTPVPFKEVRR